MGIAGAAWATGVSQATSAIILATHYLSKKNTQQFILPAFNKVWLVLKSGAGTSLHFAYLFVAILFFNNLIMDMAGGNGIVVFTVVLNVSMIAMSIFEGLSQTVQPMFAVYHGERNNEAMKVTYWLSLFATVILGGAATVLLVLFPLPLIALFGITEASIVSDSASAIRIFSLCIVLMTFNVIMGYYYQSTERIVLAAVIVALRNLFALLAGAVILGNIFGINGVWGAYLFAEVVAFIIWFMYVKICSRNKNLTGGILLLPAQPNVYSRYLHANLNELHTVIEEIKTFFDTHSIAEERAARVMLAVDELVTNVIKHGSNGNLSHVEVRIVLEGGILLIVRDDGVLFDHSVFTEGKTADTNGYGLKLVDNTTSSFEYRPVLGLNRTLIQYQREVSND
jgi:anti-sigma regulatory factor (Ser/Thr protein kinase)